MSSTYTTCGFFSQTDERRFANGAHIWQMAKKLAKFSEVVS